MSGSAGGPRERTGREAGTAPRPDHTCAALLIGEGVSPKIVSERLGHATVAFTLDVYAYAVPGWQAEAAVASLVFG
jgi:integrase